MLLFPKQNIGDKRTVSLTKVRDSMDFRTELIPLVFIIKTSVLNWCADNQAFDGEKQTADQIVTIYMVENN